MSRTQCTGWPNKKKDFLKKLWPHYCCGDLTINDLAKVFCCKPRTVWQYAKEMGLKGRQQNGTDQINTAYLKKIGFDLKI